MMPSYYFERALFVVGDPDAGKSNQLRSMFRDVRLGTGGKIPKEKKLPELYRLSNERCLYLRLTSPHKRKNPLAGNAMAARLRRIFWKRRPRQSGSTRRTWDGDGTSRERFSRVPGTTCRM
ncbi:MAG TPA: hypothetical protein VGQ12_17550 [Candidatus Angelobacter sp.]|jgi:hypothetical protein|nr:hypothetical protein [Candidatus Angelobacter sp.]